MPLLDVSEAITDPMLADTFAVIRRRQTVSDKGRASWTSQRIDDVPGVVCMAGPDDLVRLDDSQRMGRVLSIVTLFRLRGPAKTPAAEFQPDEIEWNGDRYVVSTVDPYVNYGSGFVQALATSTASVQKPPE